VPGVAKVGDVKNKGYENKFRTAETIATQLLQTAGELEKILVVRKQQRST